MKTHSLSPKSGFTLLETVIAIGVLAVLLTGFMAVFGPAASGIRRAINVQELDRLSSTLERELVTERENPDTRTGFEKAFEWVRDSHSSPSEALLVYQYRGRISKLRLDGTYEAFKGLKGIPGKDYVVQPMVRRQSDPLFLEDVEAIEGAIFFVKCRQLVQQNGELVLGAPGAIVDADGTTVADSDTYPEAVIAFAAEFFSLPTKAPSYFQGGGFAKRFDSTNPVFTRNLAVRR